MRTLFLAWLITSGLASGLLGGQVDCLAAELPPGVEAKLAAEKAAAAAATRSAVTRAVPTTTRMTHSSAARIVSQSLSAVGPIAIDSVAIVAPVSASAVPRFGKLELLITIPVLSATKPFDPDPATGGLDLSAIFAGPSGSRMVKGFWDGAGWRVRFAPDAVGAWTFSVSASDSSGMASWNGGSFTCVASANPGYLRINGSALTFSGSGRNFIGIGHNTGWMPQVEHPAISGETPATAAYGTVPGTALLPASRSMVANGENLLSFWISTPWESPAGGFANRAPIEATSTGIGSYNQPTCQYLDELFAKAEAAGVYLEPAIWPHDLLRGNQSPWGAASWDKNAYSSLCTAAEFVITTSGGVDTPQWAAQKKFYRYLIARYGYSPALAGWIGLVEVNGIDAYAVNQAQTVTWCHAVRSFFANQDQAHASGTAYPIAFHGTGAALVGFDTSDERVVDSYDQEASNLGVANVIAPQTLTMSSNAKPRFHAEFGGNISKGATQPTHLHNGVWAGIAAGATLSPLVWTDGQNFPRLSDGSTGVAMQDHLRWLSQFLVATPWANANGLVSASVVNTSAMRGWNSRLSDRGYGWGYQPSGVELGNQTLNVTTGSGSYAVWWFDPNADCSMPVVSTTVNAIGTTLSLSIPTALQSRKDIAWRYQRRPTATDMSTSLVANVPGVIDLGNSANGLYTVTITSLPTHTALYQTADGITLGTPITTVPAIISGLSLRVMGVADNVSPSDSFQLTVNEGAASSTPVTMSLAITQVNHAPYFTMGSDVQALEDAGVQTVVNWATGISSGAGDLPQTLTFVVTTPDTALPLFSAPPAISPNGTLTYTPAPNAIGTALVTVALRDDGGVANGGGDTSASQTFTITLVPVNDAPSFIAGADIGVIAGSGPNGIVGWATSLSAGPADESTQFLDFLVTTARPDLFVTPPFIQPNGTLVLDAAPGAIGTATITIVLHDNGGTANGGSDTSPSQSVVITVMAPANKAPTAIAQAVSTGEDTPVAVLLSGSDPEGQLLSFAITSAPAHGVLSGTAPNLIYTPSLNYAGSDSVAFIVSDGGLTSAPATIAITVTAVNDAPVVSNLSISTYQKRAVAIILSVTDCDSSEFTFIVGSPAHGALSGSAPNLTYTPAAGFSGNDSFTYAASDGQATSATATVSIAVSPLFEASINFQPTSVPIPTGYLKDDGAVYAARGNGLSYGWNAANNVTRDRNSARSLDQRYDTLIHLQKSTNANARWDIAVPNGTYEVTLVSGDATAFDSVFRLNVEDVLVVSGTPTTTSRWVSGTARVVVTDGKLTVSNGTGASNNKLCFIDLIQVPPGVAN